MDKSDCDRGLVAVMASLLIHLVAAIALSMLLTGHRRESDAPQLFHVRLTVDATRAKVVPSVNDVLIGSAAGSAIDHDSRAREVPPGESPTSQNNFGLPSGRSTFPVVTLAAPKIDETTLFLSYASAKELTTQPSLIGTFPDIGIPWVRSSRGRVVVDVYIDEVGVVRDARIVEHANMPRSLLARIPLLWRTMRFVPGEIDSGAVASRIRIEMAIGEEEQ